MLSRSKPSWVRYVRGTALRVALLFLAAAFVEKAAAYLLVAAPNYWSDPAPGEPPDDAHRVRIARDGVNLEAFVFEPETEPRATVVLLHGIWDSKDSFLDMGRQFSDAGYRAVVMDLRGHGHSSGAYLSYGLSDGSDVTAIIDAVERDAIEAGGELGPLMAVGVSYGGAAALRFSAHDPRVRAVATLATFARLRDVLPSYAQLIAPALPEPPGWLVEMVIEDAHAQSGFDYARCDSRDAVRAIRVPILFLHGDEDMHIPYPNVERLYGACAPGLCRLERRAGDDHLSLIGDEASWIAVRAFFDEILAS